MKRDTEIERVTRIARRVALTQAREAIQTLQRTCRDNPGGKTASMIYGHAIAAIDSLISQSKSSQEDGSQ